MGNRQESIIQFRTKRFTDAITRPANAAAYAAGDVISEVTTNDHLTFGTATAVDGSGNPVGAPGKLSGSIDVARCFSSANQSTLPDLELWLFHTDIAEVADNSAFAPTDAEMLTLIGIIDFPVADWKVGTATAGAGGNAVCEARQIGLPFRLATQVLYGQLVVRNAYTPVTSETFTVELVVTQD